MVENKIVSVPVSSIRPGDTVVLNGVAKTVNREYIHHCPFMGSSIFGDCRALHGRKVDVMLFPKWFKGKMTGYVRQL
jgi:hypothetical protein